MRWTVLLLAVAAAIALLAGCGGERPGDASGGAASGGGNNGAAEPTPLTARFAQPTTIISITTSSAVTSTAVVTGTPEPAVAPEDLERGAKLYASKGCADCHGAQGEGVADKGSAVAGIQLDEEQFVDVMRTGGKGELGNDHIYGPNAISPGGLSAMYAWIKSLPAQ